MTGRVQIRNQDKDGGDGSRKCLHALHETMVEYKVEYRALCTQLLAANRSG